MRPGTVAAGDQRVRILVVGLVVPGAGAFEAGAFAAGGVWRGDGLGRIDTPSLPTVVLNSSGASVCVHYAPSVRRTRWSLIGRRHSVMNRLAAENRRSRWGHHSWRW